MRHGGYSWGLRGSVLQRCHRGKSFVCIAAIAHGYSAWAVPPTASPFDRAWRSGRTANPDVAHICRVDARRSDDR
ncbi:hypothetical protein [Lysobacter gummosus]|uniref:hypothetical protein n=1 Tax=Lysobacter gummosus TaxID=262324 RepID=UPI00363A0593